MGNGAENVNHYGKSVGPRSGLLLRESRKGRRRKRSTQGRLLRRSGQIREWRRYHLLRVVADRHMRRHSAPGHQQTGERYWACCLAPHGLRRFDWSRPAFLIGFVLAKPVEQYSNNAYQISTFRMDQGLQAVLDYLLSPIVWVLIAITLLSVIVGIRQAKNIQAEGEVPAGLKRPPFIFLITLLVFTGWFMVEMYTIPDYAWVDAVFPVVISTFTFGCLLGLLAFMVLRPEKDLIFADRELEVDENQHSFWGTLGWFAGLLVLTSLTGFIIALSVFLLCFFLIRARESLSKTLIYSFSGLGFMLFMGWLLNRDFPPGLLQEFVNLPWPLT